MSGKELVLELANPMNNAYNKACDKHPKFHDGIVVKVTPERLKVELAQAREYCELHNERKELCFYDLIREELLEYFDAALSGDWDAARAELMNCFAVLMREYERVADFKQEGGSK